MPRVEQRPCSPCRSVLPACAKLAMAGDTDVREAGQAALVAFAVRSGSMSVLDKVRRRACGAVGAVGGCGKGGEATGQEPAAL